MKYFKLVHAPTWKIPHYMKGIVFICIRHKVNVIFNFLRYLRLPNALQGISFLKKMIFNEIFKIGSCPNLKDSSLYERYCIHMYKAGSTRNLQQFSSICHSLIPCTVQFFLTKILFMKYFKLVHAPTWKIPHFMIGFLSICTRHEAFGFFDCFALSVTPLCFVGYFCWKRMTFHDIFQIGACQNLKDSSLYDRFSIQMYKAWSIRYFQHFSSICDSLMPSKVLFF